MAFLDPYNPTQPRFRRPVNEQFAALRFGAGAPNAADILPPPSFSNVSSAPLIAQTPNSPAFRRPTAADAQAAFDGMRDTTQNIDALPQTVASPARLGEFGDSAPGVNRHASVEGVFKGKGVNGENVYSDSGFDPNFRGTAGNKAFAERYTSDSARVRQYGMSRAGTDQYEADGQRRAQIDAGLADYKAYVGAGKPLYVDGKRIVENDFIQARKEQDLSNFFGRDPAKSGNGLPRFDMGGPRGNQGALDPLKAAKAIVDIEGGQIDNDGKLIDNASDTQKLDFDRGKNARDQATTVQDLQRREPEVYAAEQKRADEKSNYFAEGFKKDPDSLRQKYGPGVSADDAAAMEYVTFITQSGEGGDPLASEVGKRGVRLLTDMFAARSNNRGFLDGNTGMAESGRFKLTDFDVGREKGFAGFMSKLVGSDGTYLQSPGFNRRTNEDGAMGEVTPINADDRHKTYYNPRQQGTAFDPNNFGPFLERMRAVERERERKQNQQE